MEENRDWNDNVMANFFQSAPDSCPLSGLKGEWALPASEKDDDTYSMFM